MVPAEVETSWHDLERSGTVGNSRRVDLLASGSPAFGHGDAEAVGRHGGERVPRGRGLVFPDDFRGEARERLGPSAGRHTGRASRRNWRRVAGPRFRKSRPHAVEIETRQLAAHVAGVRAGRPPRSRLLAPSRRRRPRLADGRSPEGTREWRHRSREAWAPGRRCSASRERTSPAAATPGSLARARARERRGRRCEALSRAVHGRGPRARWTRLMRSSIHVKRKPFFFVETCLAASLATARLRCPLLPGSIIRERSPPGWASGRPGRSTRAADAPSKCGPAAPGRWRGRGASA